MRRCLSDRVISACFLKNAEFKPVATRQSPFRGPQNVGRPRPAAVARRQTGDGNEAADLGSISAEELVQGVLRVVPIAVVQDIEFVAAVLVPTRGSLVEDLAQLLAGLSRVQPNHADRRAVVEQNGQQGAVANQR